MRRTAEPVVIQTAIRKPAARSAAVVNRPASGGFAIGWVPRASTNAQGPSSQPVRTPTSGRRSPSSDSVSVTATSSLPSAVRSSAGNGGASASAARYAPS